MNWQNNLVRSLTSKFWDEIRLLSVKIMACTILQNIKNRFSVNYNDKAI